MTTYIIFHAKKTQPFIPCIDGLFSAVIAKKSIPEAKLVPSMYGHPPDLVLKSGDVLYLLDLTYPAPIIEAWAKIAEVKILDHHKTALNDLKNLSTTIFKEFDMQRSGAMIAWEYFFPNEPIPQVIKHVQDRDLWVKSLPNTDRIHLGLLQLTKGLLANAAVNACAELLYSPLDALIEIGIQREVVIEEAINAALKRISHRQIAGYKAPFILLTGDDEKEAYSDIANRILKLDLVASFAVVQVGRGWALRSLDDRVDVSAIAKQFGGGGHRNASGCMAELPYWIESIMSKFRR